MYRKWPNTIGVNRDMIAESWEKYPEIMDEADRFVENGVATILNELTSEGTISSLDGKQLNTMLEELGNKVSELFFGLNLARPMDLQLLTRTLKAGFTIRQSIAICTTPKITLNELPKVS